eukprot:403348480
MKADFICPFNAYHKQPDARKLTHHVQRCGDRKGKVVYTCQFNSSHIYITALEIVKHEQYCELRPKEENDDCKILVEPNITEKDQIAQLQVKASKRRPTCAYCKYNVQHVFKTIEERDFHEELCNDKQDYDANYRKTKAKFDRLKYKIQEAKEQKKLRNQQQIELGLATNTPDQLVMPTLQYKYCMNEPFIGGTNAQVQTSHENLIFKRNLTYQYNVTNQMIQDKKTEDDIKKEQCDLWDKVKSNCKVDDLTSFTIKQDDEYLFSLEVVIRQSYHSNVFEFNIKEYISLERFKYIVENDFGDFEKTKQFWEDNIIYKLNRKLMEDISSSLLSGVYLESLQQSIESQKDEEQKSKLNTIAMCELNEEILEEPIEMQQTSCKSRKTYLFLLTKHTPQLSMYLEASDFTVILFKKLVQDSVKSDIKSIIHSDDIKIKQNPNSQELQIDNHLISPEFIQHSIAVEQLKIEFQKLQVENQRVKSELENSKILLEENDFSLKDYKKKFQFQEVDLKKLKGSNQELQQQIERCKNSNKKEISRYEVEAKAKKNTINQLKDKIDSLKKQIDEMKKKRIELDEKISQEDIENFNLKLEVQQLKDLLTTINKQLKAASVQNQEFLTERDETQKCIQKLKESKKKWKKAATDAKTINSTVSPNQLQQTVNKESPIKPNFNQLNYEQQQMVNLILRQQGMPEIKFDSEESYLDHSQQEKVAIAESNLDIQSVMKLLTDLIAQPLSSPDIQAQQKLLSVQNCLQNQDSQDTLENSIVQHDDDAEIIGDDYDYEKIRKYKEQLRLKKRMNHSENNSYQNSSGVGFGSVVNNPQKENSFTQNQQQHNNLSLSQEVVNNQPQKKVQFGAPKTQYQSQDIEITHYQANKLANKAILPKIHPQKQKQQDVIDNTPDDFLCVICMNNRREIVIQSCKHLVYCKDCNFQYDLKKNVEPKDCPICRQNYKKVFRIKYA